MNNSENGIEIDENTGRIIKIYNWKIYLHFFYIDSEGNIICSSIDKNKDISTYKKKYQNIIDLGFLFNNEENAKKFIKYRKLYIHLKNEWEEEPLRYWYGLTNYGTEYSAEKNDAIKAFDDMADSIWFDIGYDDYWFFVNYGRNMSEYKEYNNIKTYIQN